MLIRVMIKIVERFGMLEQVKILSSVMGMQVEFCSAIFPKMTKILCTIYFGWHKNIMFKSNTADVAIAMRCTLAYTMLFTCIHFNCSLTRLTFHIATPMKFTVTS